MVFFGVVLGSIFASSLFYHMPHKTMLWVSYIILGLSLYMLVYFKNFWLMSISRIIAGMAETIIVLYFPLYIDTFMVRELKAKLMPLPIMSGLIGTILGYGYSSYVINRPGGTW